MSWVKDCIFQPITTLHDLYNNARATHLHSSETDEKKIDYTSVQYIMFGIITSTVEEALHSMDRNGTYLSHYFSLHPLVLEDEYKNKIHIKLEVTQK